MYYVHLHYHVLIQKVRKCGRIGSYTPDLGGSQKYVFGLFLFKKILDVLLPFEIKFRMCSRYYIAGAVFLKLS